MEYGPNAPAVRAARTRHLRPADAPAPAGDTNSTDAEPADTSDHEKDSHGLH